MYIFWNCNFAIKSTCDSRKNKTGNQPHARCSFYSRTQKEI